MNRVAVKEIIYCCVRGFDEKIPDCIHAMHAKCSDEIQRSMIHCWHNGGSKRLDRLHCHRDLCIHTDGAWRMLKTIAFEKMLGTIQMNVSFV